MQVYVKKTLNLFFDFVCCFGFYGLNEDILNMYEGNHPLK